MLEDSDDWASTVGVKNGIAAKIKLLDDAALYTHCYSHALNLAVKTLLEIQKT